MPIRLLFKSLLIAACFSYFLPPFIRSISFYALVKCTHNKSLTYTFGQCAKTSFLQRCIRCLIIWLLGYLACAYRYFYWIRQWSIINAVHYRLKFNRMQYLRGGNTFPGNKCFYSLVKYSNFNNSLSFCLMQIWGKGCVIIHFTQPKYLIENI